MYKSGTQNGKIRHKLWPFWVKNRHKQTDFGGGLIMAKLNWETPNGNSGNVDLDKIFTTDGGTINGAITFNNESIISIKRVGTTGGLMICGANNDLDGAHLTLAGKNNTTEANAGAFFIRAYKDDAVSPYLSGYPSGRLVWDSETVECLNLININCIRYRSGLQIHHGSARSDSNGYVTVTYSKPFNEKPHIIITPHTIDNNIPYTFRVISSDSDATQVKVKILGGQNTGIELTFHYIAIGTWK